MPESDKKQPDLLSKTQRKKDMHSLQDLGKTLIGLSESQLAELPLPDELLRLIRVAKTLKTHEAKRRHMQYVGKIMRQFDTEPLMKALTNMQLGTIRQTEQFHKIETLRDMLIAEGDDGMQKLLAEFPEADRQQVRQLVRKAQQDVARGTNSGAALELFRYLRELQASR